VTFTPTFLFVLGKTNFKEKLLAIISI